uniref:Uncharacterized protein n=1 Tax=Plectus sambesii TaxID=2011161 RepID=A0A914VGJ9_9BILA
MGKAFEDSFQRQEQSRNLLTFGDINRSTGFVAISAGGNRSRVFVKHTCMLLLPASTPSVFQRGRVFCEMAVETRSKNFEPERTYHYNTYTERRTYGRDENGEVVITIEKDPGEPVRPLTPVRPVTPIGDYAIRPIEPIQNIPPLQDIPPIPRIEHRRPSSGGAAGNRHSPPRTTPPMSDERRRSSGASRSYSPPSPISPQSHSPRSNRSNGFSDDDYVPRKKIIKKKRWVSIHDGRPVSPYTETVSYVPSLSPHLLSVQPARREVRRSSPVSFQEPPRSSPTGYQQQRHSPNYNQQHQRRRSSPTFQIPGECSLLEHNPLYRGD